MIASAPSPPLHGWQYGSLPQTFFYVPQPSRTPMPSIAVRPYTWHPIAATNSTPSAVSERTQRPNTTRTADRVPEHQKRPLQKVVKEETSDFVALLPDPTSAAGYLAWAAQSLRAASRATSRIPNETTTASSACESNGGEIVKLDSRKRREASRAWQRGWHKMLMKLLMSSWVGVHEKPGVAVRMMDLLISSPCGPSVANVKHLGAAFQVKKTEGGVS